MVSGASIRFEGFVDDIQSPQDDLERARIRRGKKRRRSPAIDKSLLARDYRFRDPEHVKSCQGALPSLWPRDPPMLTI
jgi:hypothetical protein